MLSASASSRGAVRRRGFRRVRIAVADPRLTGHAGVAAVTEADRVLGIADALDGAVGRLKRRDRGLTAGGLMLSMASAQLAGADFLVGMDRRRSDMAGQLLEPVPTPASTTTAQLAKRFTATQLAGIENGIGVVNARVLGVVSARRRTQLLTTATIDGDTTDVEVYGTKKQDAVYNYQGQRAYRPHIAFWADGGVTLAADLMKADEDPRPGRRATVGPGDRATPAGSGEDPVSLGRRVFRRGPGRALHRQGHRVRDRSETEHRRGPRLPERADRRMAPGEGHGAHRGRRHRLPARDVAGRRRRHLYRPADPDPGRVDAHRSAGPETADHRQGPTGVGVGRDARSRVRVFVHPDQPGRLHPRPNSSKPSTGTGTAPTSKPSTGTRNTVRRSVIYRRATAP